MRTFTNITPAGQDHCGAIIFDRSHFEPDDLRTEPRGIRPPPEISPDQAQRQSRILLPTARVVPAQWHSVPATPARAEEPAPLQRPSRMVLLNKLSSPHPELKDIETAIECLRHPERFLLSPDTDADFDALLSLKLSLVDWKTTIRTHGEAARGLWHIFVMRELYSDMRLTLPVRDIELLTELNPEQLDLLVKKYMWRVWGAADNIDELLARAAKRELSAFERLSLATAQTVFHAVMGKALQIVKASPERFSLDLKRNCGRYETNLKLFEMQTRKLRKSFGL